MLAGCSSTEIMTFSLKPAIIFHPLWNQGARKEQEYDTEWEEMVSESTAAFRETSEEQDCQRQKAAGLERLKLAALWRGILSLHGLTAGRAM